MRRREPLVLLGARIRELRLARTMSQEKLAELADLNRNYVGEVERGERNVAAINILRISRALGLLPGELFTPFDAATLKRLKLS